MKNPRAIKSAMYRIHSTVTKKKEKKRKKNQLSDLTVVEYDSS